MYGCRFEPRGLLALLVAGSGQARAARPPDRNHCKSHVRLVDRGRPCLDTSPGAARPRTEVPEYMQKYRGREPELVESICSKYRVAVPPGWYKLD